MSRFNYYKITHGHIVVAWYFILLAHTYKGILIENAISIVKRSGILGGSIPFKLAIKFCIDYDLLHVKKNKFFITEFTKKNIIPICYDYEPNVKVQRIFLKQIMSFHNFEWLLYFDSTPDLFRETLKELDIEWVDLLDNAILFDFENEDVNVWWDDILVKYEDYKIEEKKKIGDVGEKMTYHFELNRIEKDGFTKPKNYVKWAARMSDKYGFDVLSIRSRMLLNKYCEKDKIKIEVKSSDSFRLKKFRFYISQNEWNIALENIESYFFYCWIGINLETESVTMGPFVIPAVDIVKFIPSNNCDFLQWTECRCIMDISKYRVDYNFVDNS